MCRARCIISYLYFRKISLERKEKVVGERELLSTLNLTVPSKTVADNILSFF